jgi:hypothetical protein
MVLLLACIPALLLDVLVVRACGQMWRWAVQVETAWHTRCAFVGIVSARIMLLVSCMQALS